MEYAPATKLLCGISVKTGADGGVTICYEAGRVAVAARALAAAKSRGLRQLPTTLESGRYCVRLVPTDGCG